MKLNNTLFAVLTLALGAIAQAQTITGFGNGEYANLAADFTTTPTASTLTIVGPDGGPQLYADTIAPVSFTGPIATSRLSLTATINVANPNGFTVAAYDAVGQEVRYTGLWSSFTVGAPTTVFLTFSSTNNLGGPVTSFQFLTGGTGQSLNITLDNLAYVPTVVPEPSTYASIAGVAMLGFVAYRRRRVAA